jgi:hypothetical protein
MGGARISREDLRLVPVKVRDRDRCGKTAVLRCEVKSNGGQTISAGETVRVENAWRGGFAVQAENPRRYITRVPRAWLDFGDGT